MWEQSLKRGEDDDIAAPSSAAKPAMGDQAILLSVEQIPQHGPMSKKIAHEHLKRLREEMSSEGRITEYVRDLTEDLMFDWRAYVCSRADAWDIIGPGIVKFEARFLRARDPNFKKLPGGLRFDFIAYHVDETAVRLHPGSSSHGQIVVGKLEDWVFPKLESWHSASAAPRGAASSASRGPVDSIGRQDTVSAFQAHAFLQSKYGASALLRGVWIDDFIDLTDGLEFPWQQFLAARPWGRSLLSRVQCFGGLWEYETNKPGFFIGLNDGDTYFVRITPDKALLESPCKNAAWNATMEAPAASRGGAWQLVIHS